MGLSEEILQQQVVDHFRGQEAKYGYPIVAAVPNAGRRNAWTGKKLKLQGMRAGFPDLIFLFPGGKVILVEMKAQSGSLSKSQKDFNRLLDGIKFPHYVITGATADEAIRKIYACLEANGISSPRPLTMKDLREKWV